MTTLTAVQQEIVDAQQRFAVWTTATRPTPVTGEFLVGFNTTLGYPEYHDGSTWRPFEPSYVTVGYGSVVLIPASSAWTTVRSLTITPRTGRVAIGATLDFDYSENIWADGTARLRVGGQVIRTGQTWSNLKKKYTYDLSHTAVVTPGALITVAVQFQGNTIHETEQVRASLFAYG